MLRIAAGAVLMAFSGSFLVILWVVAKLTNPWSR